MPGSSNSGTIMAQPLPPELQQVVQLVDNQPEALARGDMGMHAAALAAVQLIYKISLDSEKSAASPISKLLSSLSPGEDAPTTRAQKRKREEAHKPPPLVFRPTPKAARLVDGSVPSLSASKLWELMEHRTGPLCGILEAVVAPEDIIEEEEEEASEDDMGDNAVNGEYQGMDYEVSDDDDEDDEDNDDDEDDGEDGDEEDEDDSDGGESYLGDTTMELSKTEEHSDPSDAEEEEIESGYLDGIDLDRADNPQKAAKRRAHPTLDDAFFSIDAFNRETEAMEAQSRTSGALNDEDDDEEDEDVDLFAQVEDIEDNEEANDPKYQDFFAPPLKTPKVSMSKAFPVASPSRPKRKVKLLVASPPKRSVKVRFNEEVKVRNVKSRRTRASLLAELVEAEEVEGDEDEWEDEDGDGQDSQASDMLGDDDEERNEDEGAPQGEASESGEKANLFADDGSENEDDEAMSSHQKRLAALNAEIKALEAENIAPKPWAMQGEATARSRPQNALLSANLEFEHVGKVVPVVTEEAVKKLEDKIKARIIEGRYDDVVRKRNVEPKPFLPSRVFELKDTQSEKSLAQIYEDEYTAAKAGPSSAPMDDRDGKLAQEHKEIEQLWDGICYKLDALSNAHFTPKQPKAHITSVSNMPSASLESALPSSLSTSTLLAPEEVYAPAVGDTRAKGELTPGEKRAARSKDRKKRKKQRDSLTSAADKFGASSSGRGAPRNVKEAKEQALKGLVKSGKGVTVVGKESRSSGGGKSIKETGAKSKDSMPERDSKKYKL